MTIRPRTLRRRATPALALVALGWLASSADPATTSVAPVIAAVRNLDAVVLDAADGRAVPGARVADADGRPLGVTDASGRLALTGPPPTAPLRVTAPGYVPLELAAWPADDAVLLLEPAAHLSAVIYDARGGVLEGAEVVVDVDLAESSKSTPLRGGLAALPRWRATTDAGGRCRFDLLPTTRPLRARVFYEDRLLREIEWALRLEPRSRERVGWIVDPGRDRVGVATDADGEPLADVHLWVVANDDDPFHRRAPRWLAEGVDEPPLFIAVTDERGRFELPDLPHRWYRIGPAPGTDLVASASSFQHELDEVPTTLRLRLDPGRALRGAVLGSDGRPLTDASVFVDQGGVDGSLGLRVDGRGRFRLHVPRTGSFRIRARDERFGFETPAVELAPTTPFVELRFD